MRRWMLHLALALSVYCVAANAQCYARCVVSNCNGFANADQAGHSCHHNPKAPGQEKSSCVHDQLPTAELQKTSISAPAGFVFCEFNQVVIATAEGLSESGSPDRSPPSTAGIVSTSILRI